MCGIVGGSIPDNALIRRMMDLLKHRGPNQKGSFVDDFVGLGHQRLSILDLSLRGKQPMSNNRQNLQIVFNGEIYNFRELREQLLQKGCRFHSETDTEVLLNAYATHGQNCMRMLNGDFAFCIYDVEKKKLILARDRLGVKPLYYFFDGDAFLFASEYKAFLAYQFSKVVNRTALARYLTFRFNYGRETLLKNVFRVLPGEIIEYDVVTKRITGMHYWDVPQPANKGHINESQYISEFNALFGDSVRKRLIGDVPIGVFLSGGIDSGAIVAAMHRAGVEKISTFSMGFNTESHVFDQDVRHARLLSKEFTTDHHEYFLGADVAKLLPSAVWHCDDPIADPALLPTWELARSAKKHATVILTGDGSDELFAGYEQHKFLRLGALPMTLRRCCAGVLSLAPNYVLYSLFSYAGQLGEEGKRRAALFLNSKTLSEQYVAINSIFTWREQKQFLNNLPANLPEVEQYFRRPGSRLQRALRFELKTALPESMLQKCDRMGMAHAVEIRVPFLDHRIVELSEKIPDNLKLNCMTEKYLLRKAMQHSLPKQVIGRKKQRFYVPIDRWLTEELQPTVDEFISPTALREGGLVRATAVQQLWEKYERAPLFYARQLWAILTLQIWLKKFAQQ